MAEKSKSCRKHFPSETVDWRTSFPIIDISDSYIHVAVKKQFNFDNTCFVRKKVLHLNTSHYNNKCVHNLSTIKKWPQKLFLHASSACGAIERLGGVPDFALGGVWIFALTPLGFGEKGFCGTAPDSLVRELLCWKW